MLPMKQEESGILSQQSPSIEYQSHRSNRARSITNLVGAILVIGVIAGTAFLLFSHRIDNLSSGISARGPMEPINSPVTVQSHAGGLEASLQITAGPYFLSELLGVDVILTNYSKKGYLIQGTTTDINSCTGMFSVTTISGGEPHFNFPVVISFVSCPFTQTTLEAGKTLKVHGYVPLLKSGEVMITPEARFLTTGSNPLDRHWPVLHINVNAKIPIDRTLSLQQQDSQVLINAPPAIKSHLVYLYSMNCVGESSTNMVWLPVTSLTLQEPGCSGLNKYWSYAVSAPGFAIASGETHH